MSNRLPDRIQADWHPVQRGIASRLCRMLLHAAGWRLILEVPRIPRGVVVFYPHTSNWDFVIGLLARFALNVPVIWAGKDNLFRGPFKALWRWLGGIPVNRRERTGFVGQMIAAFASGDAMLLAIAPEGTRRRTEYWKSGFYRVAVASGVPLVLAFIDYSRKEIGVGSMFEPTGDVERDFGRLRAFYREKTGRHPQQAAPIRLQPEPLGERAGAAIR